MPSVIKRKTSQYKGGVMEPYDGPEPTPGAYPAEILKCTYRLSGNGNPQVYILARFSAPAGSSKAQYDGYTANVRTTFGESDIQLEKEQSLYLAISGKQDADIKLDGDASKAVAGDPATEVKILSIGGVAPVGKKVGIMVRRSGNPDYPLDMDRIYRLRETDAAAEPDDEDEEEADSDHAEDEGIIEAYEEEELTGKGLPALRKILVDEFEMDEDEAKLLKTKAKLIAAILEAQEEIVEEDELEEDEEEDELEEDEDEEEEEDEEDEFAEMDRSALKARIKKASSTFKVTTKMTDDDLRDWLRKNDVPF